MKNVKFDVDLKYGQKREQRIKKMIEEGTIEVKTERNWWYKTGNIAVEYESFGKPVELLQQKQPIGHMY